MPRHPTTTAAELEHQAAADSQLGDLDEHGLELLPSFDAEPPTHEQQIAELDARDDRLNGHATEVRPSQRCKIKSPTGIGCTLHKSHEDQHSWESAGAVSDSAVNYSDNIPSAEQPALPGTPEPEVDENYAIPTEAQFNGGDFKSAPGLKAIAEQWIAETEELAHLRGIEIRYFWKRRGGLKGGNPRLGNLVRPSGLAGYALGRPIYALWLASNHCRDLKLAPEQIRAAVLHELCKSALDEDNDDGYKVVGPDAEIFALEIEKVGLWSLDLREVGAHIKQLGLLDSLELSDDAEDQDADEGEESE